jgi:hypothetical protein
MASDKNKLGRNKTLHLVYCAKEERLKISGNKVRDLNGKMIEQWKKEN